MAKSEHTNFTLSAEETSQLKQNNVRHIGKSIASNHHKVPNISIHFKAEEGSKCFVNNREAAGSDPRSPPEQPESKILA